MMFSSGIHKVIYFKHLAVVTSECLMSLMNNWINPSPTYKNTGYASAHGDLYLLDPMDPPPDSLHLGLWA